MFVFMLFNAGVPVRLNWVGEVMVLMGLWRVYPMVRVVLARRVVFRAGYRMWMFGRMAYGNW